MIYHESEKLIKKLKSKPHNFTFDEAETLLNYLYFSRSDKGNTSGSHVKFTSENHGAILLHKPHPRKELLEYQVKQLREKLEHAVTSAFPQIAASTFLFRTFYCSQ